MNEKRNRFWLVVSTGLFSVVGSFVAASLLFLRQNFIGTAILTLLVAFVIFVGAMFTSRKSLGVSDERWRLDEAVFFFVEGRVPENDGAIVQHVEHDLSNWSEAIPNEAEKLKKARRGARTIFRAASRGLIRAEGIFRDIPRQIQEPATTIPPSYFATEVVEHHVGDKICLNKDRAGSFLVGFKNVVLYKEEIIDLKRQSENVLMRDENQQTVSMLAKTKQTIQRIGRRNGPTS
ncbi:MAG: hypothetical protein AAGB02_05060 [Pseudomonadota bacterium]